MTKACCGGLVVYFVLAHLVGLSPAQVGLRPIPVEEALRVRYFPKHSLLALAPQGDYVAYTLVAQVGLTGVTDERQQFYDEKGVGPHGQGTSLWVTETKSGSAKALVQEGSNSWGPSWSPDGRYLAFYSDKGGQAAVWLWEKSTGNVRRVSDLVVRAPFGYEVPQWTPESTEVIVPVLPEGLTLRDAADLLGARPESKRGADSNLAASAVVYSSSKPSEPKSSPGTGVAANALYVSDLVLIDVRSGLTRRLLRGCSPTRFTISPDGRYVAFLSLDGLKTVPSGRALFDIVIVSVKDGTKRVVASGVKLVGHPSFSWSPDSKLISYTTSWEGQGEGDCYVVPVGGGEPRNLTPGSHPSFGTLDTQPLWDPSGRGVYCVREGSLWFVPVSEDTAVELAHGLGRQVLGVVAAYGRASVWSPDRGKSVYVCARDPGTQQEGFYRIDVTTGEQLKLTEGNESFGTGSFVTESIAPSRDGREIAYLAQDAQHCNDVWLAGSDFRSPRRITNTNPGLDLYAMGKPRIIEWRTEDGLTLRGALLLPAGYRKGFAYPTIVEVYGGMSGSDLVNQFGLGDFGVSNKQLLATRGYVVFAPDIPLHTGTPMRDIAKAVLPGVDKLVNLGIADPERIGVTGRSYGGYTTLALIVQSNRFKAAIARSSVGADLFSFYCVMSHSSGGSVWASWAEQGQGRMGGTPWDYRDRYIENSPFFYLDRVQTPLMLIQGGQDIAVPSFTQEQVFVALNRLGKEVVYVNYPHGGHSEPSLNYADSVDYFNRMIEWFDEKLKMKKSETSGPVKEASRD